MAAPWTFAVGTLGCSYSTVRLAGVERIRCEVGGTGTVLSSVGDDFQRRELVAKTGDLLIDCPGLSQRNLSLFSFQFAWLGLACIYQRREYRHSRRSRARPILAGSRKWRLPESPRTACARFVSSRETEPSGSRHFAFDCAAGLAGHKNPCRLGFGRVLRGLFAAFWFSAKLAQGCSGALLPGDCRRRYFPGVSRRCKRLRRAPYGPLPSRFQKRDVPSRLADFSGTTSLGLGQ